MRVCLLFLLAASTASGLTVRVESPDGAPRLVVNGKPVRARMFWGAPGAAPIPLSNDWQQVHFEFTAAESAANGTMHFPFGQQPGEVELRDIKVIDLDVGNWTAWPPTLAGAVQQTSRARQSDCACRRHMTGIPHRLAAGSDDHAGAAVWRQVPCAGHTGTVACRRLLPEVAAVIDEQSMLRVAPSGCEVTRKGIYEVRAPLGRMGAPYGQYLLDDVLAGRVRAKLFVFVNGWSYSHEERARLARAVRGKSLFVETAGVTSEALREAARAAGVHLFTATDCNVYANGRILALHAAQDGPVDDVLTGERVAPGPKFSLPINRGQTRLLSY